MNASAAETTAALAEHAEFVRAGSFRTADGIGFCVVDMTSAPPRGMFLSASQGGKLSAAAVSYPQGIAGDAPLAALAADAFDQPASQIPISRALRAFGLMPGEGDAARRSAEAFRAAYGSIMEADDVTAAEQARFESSGLSELRPLLDARSLRALRAVEEFSTAEYGFYAAVGDRGMRRSQAADVYPLLAGAMARKPTVKLAIDAQKPLNDALTAAFGSDEAGRPRLGKAMLRRLQGIEWLTEGVSPEKVASALGEVSPDWFPKTSEDWRAFCLIADTVGRTLRDVTGSRLDVLCAGCGGKWHAYAQTIAKAYTDTGAPEDLDPEAAAAWVPPQPEVSLGAMRNACLDAEDMVESFSRLIVLPVAANAAGGEPYLSEVQRSQARIAAARILLGGKAAPAVFELSRHWHTQQEAIVEAAIGEDAARAKSIMKEVAEDGWPPLCNSVQASNGVWIVPLTDPRELAAEGKHGKDENGIEGLHHCVGGYSATCRESGHHIVSLRRIDPQTGDYTRLSTAEISRIAHGSTELGVRQHRGKLNHTPPQEALDAFAWFEASVRNGSITLNYEGMRSYLVTKHENRDDVKIICGYDWKDREAISRAMRPWAPYVGKKYRKMALDEFMAEPEIADVAALISPPAYRQAP